MTGSHYNAMDMAIIEGQVARRGAEAHADTVALVAYARAAGAPDIDAAYRLVHEARKALRPVDQRWPVHPPEFIELSSWIDGKLRP